MDCAKLCKKFGAAEADGSALSYVVLYPNRITQITAAALVLLPLQRGPR